MAKVLIPIPARDFDPTEVAIPWKVLTERGHAVAFATPDGRPGAADEIMVTGKGLPLVGGLLRANAEARAAYAAMLTDPAFQTPRRWDDFGAFDGLLLPGGHRARGMRAYLESPELQAAVVQAFAASKPVAAICHGVLLAARSLDPSTGRSVLHGHKTTALTWALERSASVLAHVFRPWDCNYYRTYVETPGQPAGFMSVQAEVTRALARPDDFLDVPADAPDRKRKTSGLERDTASDASPAFVVRDGRYVSARWPGDAHAFAATFAQVLDEAILLDAG
ncbi:type 1 glutamine amidotransferase domain-containing protein [Caulobacter soli]|uniref:type 1 glutamine amidotransferase domain-containing protein n=1 Tax=Caulobacter soli TaxID=2708539 RepID=UPI0013EA1C5E|nr:type 1 glutamine amidotransferase domain-containing protein [Caulobacter soli]